MTYTDFVKTVESTSWHQPNERLLHAAMGLCTEVGELYNLNDEQHEIEELGDICWYVALALDAAGSSWEAIRIVPEDEFLAVAVGNNPVEAMVLLGTDLLDLVKKQIFYGREIKIERVLEILALLKNSLHYGIALADMPVTLDDIINANIKKLTARFPEKFSEDAANNRDVKAEYAAMNR